jgi:dihydroxyacetone kinase-like predicted kinase
VGLVEGEPVAETSSFEEAALAVIDRLLAEPRGVLTLLTGEEPPPLVALLAELAAHHPGLEVDVHEGGQPGCALLLSAE